MTRRWFMIFGISGIERVLGKGVFGVFDLQDLGTLGWSRLSHLSP